MTVTETAAGHAVPRVPGGLALGVRRRRGARRGRGPAARVRVAGHALKLLRDPFGFLKSLAGHGEWQAGTGLHREAYIPFGAGNRKCIGDQLAWTEATIALATLLPRRRLVPASGHTPKEVVSAVPHADRIPMTVRPRQR